MTDLTWEPIAGAQSIAVDDRHTFGTDALLLAAFANPKRGERICDLGTGCGAIAFRLCAAGIPAAVHGIDADDRAVRLCTLSARRFTADPHPTFAVGDWTQPSSLGESGSFHRVVCNPPYFPPDSGKTGATDARRMARHEQPGTLTAVCRAAAWLLQNGGKFCLCHRPERLTAVLAALTAAGLEPKRLCPVCETAQTPPWLLLIEAKKGGHPGLNWEAPLCRTDGNGNITAAWTAIYGGSAT